VSTDDDDGPNQLREPLTQAVRAYRAQFGRMPPIMGIPSARYPELIAELQAAVHDGVPRSGDDILRALGMGPLPPGADA
jgi:hypothetical protein